MITVGLDIGTTHTKVLALEVESGETVALESAPTPIERSPDGEAHEAAEVLDVVVELIARVVRAVGDADGIAALCAASVGEEVVLLDEAGRPVGETIAWYDRRGFEEAAAFAAGPGGELALSRRWPPDPTFSLFKLMWSRDHRADEYTAATTWTDLGDYVLAGLGADVVMDWTHASRAGAFDLGRRNWDRESIEAAGLDIAFPSLVPSGTVVGAVAAEVAERTGLPAGVRIVTGGHDHLCAAYGAGVRTGAELFLSAGTSEAHLALIESPLDGDRARGLDQGCYVDAEHYYVHVNIHSGHFFKQWRGLLYEGVDDEPMYEEIAAAEPDAGIAFELSDGLRSGRLDHVPYDAGRAALMRAVLEGLARSSAHIVDRLERAGGAPYELILAAGHPTRVALWRSLRQAAYGRPMAAVAELESAAFGAAVMAAQAVDAPGSAALTARRTSWA
jgi:xylulokinase